MLRKRTYEVADELIWESCDELGLEQIEITAGRGSYPEGLHAAIIGFDTYEEAETFAEAHDMEVHEFSTSDGWQFWYDGGRVTEPFDLSKIHDNDIFDMVDYDDEATLLDEIQRIVNESMTDSVESIEAEWKRVDELVSEFKALDENEFVYWSGTGGCWRTGSRKTMRYTYDTKTFVIGCAFKNIGKPDEEEED